MRSDPAALRDAPCLSSAQSPLVITWALQAQVKCNGCSRLPLDEWNVARLRLTLNHKYIITIDRHKESQQYIYTAGGSSLSLLS